MLLTLVLSNLGSLADTYVFTPTSPAWWLNTSVLPASATLQPGASTIVQVTVSAPAAATIGTIQRVRGRGQQQHWISRQRQRADRDSRDRDAKLR